MAVDASTIITDEMRAWIGRSTGRRPMPEPIAPSDVRRYVEATGETNPLWTDDEYARKAGYKARVIPPMVILEQYRRGTGGDKAEVNIWESLPLPPSYTDTRNAGSEIELLEPVYLGDHLSLEHRLVDIVARSGRAGLGIYITRESEFQNQDGKPVVRLRQTVVKLPARAVAESKTEEA